MLNRFTRIALAALLLVLGALTSCQTSSDEMNCRAGSGADCYNVVFRWTVDGNPASVSTCPPGRDWVVQIGEITADRRLRIDTQVPCSLATLGSRWPAEGRVEFIALLHRLGSATSLIYGGQRPATITNQSVTYVGFDFPLASLDAGPDVDGASIDVDRCVGVTCRAGEICNPTSGVCMPFSELPRCDAGTFLVADSDGGFRCITIGQDAVADAPADLASMDGGDGGGPVDAAPRSDVVESDRADGAPPDASGCPAGFGRCEGVCLPLTRDNQNCGRCGVVCDAATQACVEGHCQQRCDGGTTCPGERACTATSAGMVCLTRCTSPRIDCGGGCTDTRTTAAHCGWCNRRCFSNEICRDGACEPVTCETTGQTLCGATCRNLQIDRANCGMCFRACATGQDCSLGVCSCRPEETLCGGACANTMFDSMNCGACGVRCAALQQCRLGTCRDICSAGLLACAVPGGVLCYGPTAAEHCGACGRQCAAGEFCARTCPTCASTCLPQCASNAILCAGACVRPNIDRANCGGCGIVCSAGQMCITGVCQL